MAAARLTDLIMRDGTARYLRDAERADATAEELLSAYTPIRRFRTRHGADFEIAPPGPVPGRAAAPAGAEPPGTAVPADGSIAAGADSGPGLPAAPASPAGPPAGTRPLAGHQPWNGPRRPERLVYADGTPLTVRVPVYPEPPARPGGTRAAVAAGVTAADGGGMLQVIRWEDGGYQAVHPALTWPASTDPYPGLDARQRQRWLNFDAAEAFPARGDSGYAFLPANLADPGDIVQLTEGTTRDLEVDRLQPVAGDPGGHDIIFKKHRSPLRHAGPGLLVPVRIPGRHPTLAAAITAAAGLAAGPAAAPVSAGTTRPPAWTPAPSPGPARHRRPAPEVVHDYNKLVRGQRARLDAAIGSGDPGQVLAACRDAVTAWNLPGNLWPPDADRWQHALDQLTPGATGEDRLLLEDLDAEPVPDDPGGTDDEPGALFDVSALTGTSSLGRAGPAPPPGRRLGRAAAQEPERARQAPPVPAAAGTPPSPASDSPGAGRARGTTPAQDAPPQPAGATPVTNADVAAALQHIAGSSPGAAWSVAQLIVHGTAPGPGAAHGPGDPRDATTWDREGLRRTILSEQPARDGTLAWEQAARWIHAGMTSGDLQILLHAGQLHAFCDGWLEHIRAADGREDAGQARAFRDTGRGAAAILQECITRVTDAAAQAHGPGAPVPASPAGSTSYRHEQAAATAAQAQILAAISELGESARLAARQITGSAEEPARKDAAPAGRPARLTSQDLAIALKRLRPPELVTAIAGTSPTVYGGSRATRGPGEPDAGASEDITCTASGIQITITAATATRAGTVTWKQVSAWLTPALTPARLRLLREATRVHLQYYIHGLHDCIDGTPGHRAVAGAEQELAVLARSAADAVIDAARDAHGPGQLPRLTATRAAAAGDVDDLFAGGGQPGAEDTGPAMQRITQLASVLPPWPARWRKPLAEVVPGDVLKHNGNPGDPFTVTAPIRRKGDITEIDGTLRKWRPGTTTTWVYGHKDNPGSQVEYYPPGGPLTGPVPAAPGAQPVIPETADTAGTDASAAAPASAPPSVPSAAGSQEAAASPAGTPSGSPDGGGDGTPDGRPEPETAGAAGRPDPAIPQSAPPAAGTPGSARPAGCTVCGEAIDPAITALGYATHPCCDPDEKPRQQAGAQPGDPLDAIEADATARQILGLAAQRGLRPRLDPAGLADGPVSIIVGIPGQPGPSGVIRISRGTGRIMSADLTVAGATEPTRYTRPGSIRAALRTRPPGQDSPAPGQAAGPRPGSAASGQPAALEPVQAGPDRDFRRRRDELHAAVDFLAGLPGYAADARGPGFAGADTGFGMFLADTPAGQWTGWMSIAAWAVLGRYAAQLGEAGISYDALPCPPGAEHMTGAELAAVHGQAEQDMAAAWPGLLRGRHGPRFIRCDGHGAVVMLGYDVEPGSDLAREAAQIPGLHGYSAAARAGLYAFASLPDVVTLAGRHSIPVTGEVRALAAAAPAPGPGRRSGYRRRQRLSARRAA